MEAALFIYAASLLDNLSKAFDVLIIGFIVCLFAACFCYLVSHDIYSSDYQEGERKEDVIKRKTRKPLKAIKFSAVGLVFSSIFWAITPSERTMYLMAGAYIGQQALTSDVSKDLQDIVGLQVKKYKKELQEKVK